MRLITPSPQVADLLTGHEERGPSWCWRPRGTATPLLIHTLAGYGSMHAVGAGRQPLGPGDTVLWLPGAAQDFGCEDEEDPWEIVWCHFRPRRHWRDWFDWPLAEQGVCRIDAPTQRTRTRVAEALLDMDASLRGLSPHATDLALNALERALLWLRGSATRPVHSDDRIEEAVLYIAHHLAEPLTISSISDAVKLSPSRLSHLFKEVVGVSPARFIELRRLERAQTLLASTDMTVGSIAQATGFSSQFYFATRFKQAHGTSPTQWRRHAVGHAGSDSPDARR
jgi:AraC family transcriptional regulator, arabinose operon regulatory protein